MCDFITQRSTHSFLEQFADTVVVYSAKCYLGARRGSWWKRKYPHLITREKFSERLLSDVWLHHTVPPFRPWDSLLTLLSWILQRDVWELIEGYGEKENILRSKLERSLLRNCIAMCECNSQSYTFLFSDQFLNRVFWKSAIWYFIAQWTLRWQRKYPQMKTRKKLS